MSCGLPLRLLCPRSRRRRAGEPRGHIYVHTDHNPDKVVSFYEIPDEVARLVQPEGDRRTFVQCLADLVAPSPQEPSREEPK
jgi:hypothetical protein